VDGGASKAPTSCGCDAQSHALRLNVRSTCPTVGQLLVRVSGLADLHVDSEIPRDRTNQWTTVRTTEAISPPRDMSHLDMTLFGKCAGTNEDLVGVHRCVLDASNCR